MKIENGTEDDLLTIVQLGSQMAEESPYYKKWGVDGEKIYHLVAYLIREEDGIVIVARDPETNEIVGGFMGGVEEMWCNRFKSMYDYALFISPTHRGGSLAIRLMNEAFKQAKEKGAVTALLSNSTGVASERVEMLYQHMGMNRRGGIYTISLKDDKEE